MPVRWELRSRTNPCSLPLSVYSHSNLIDFHVLIKAIGLVRIKWWGGPRQLLE